MSRMLCKCGAIMGSSVSPSPYSICVYYEREVQSAIADNPEILLSDFLTEWDEVNGEHKVFTKRSEPVEYWYCTECQRVYETQTQIGGHWLRVYHRTADQVPYISLEEWTRIYVLEDVETDAVLEESPKMLLSDYLQMHASVRYLLSPDERMVVAVSTENQKVQFTYMQEAAEPVSK